MIRTPVGESRRSRRQAGMAAGEVLLLLVPLCVLCMAGASRLAATSSARLRSQWEVAARVQREARVPCGGRGAAEAHAQKTAAVPAYLHRRTADRAFEDGVDRVTTGATFLCNEPGDPGDAARTSHARKIELLTRTEARRLFGQPGGAGAR